MASSVRSLHLIVCSALLLCLYATASNAQQSNSPSTGSIAGQVTPSHDHDLVLATARIADLAIKVDIEGDGSFRFDNIKPGSYVIEVRVPSVGVAAETVDVVAGETAALEIVLQPGSHFDEIVVTASADARSSLDLATPTTSLSGDELALRMQGSLGETLSQEAGVSSSFFGPGASRPIIRGLSGDRVRMLEGGVGVGDASGVSADHAVSVDPEQAESIEVLRGPATLLYGSSAVGGVVNVIDERVPTHRANGGPHGNVHLEASSVDEGRKASVNLNGGSGHWAWNADASVRQTDDYDIPGLARLEEEGHADENHGDPEGPRGTVPNTDIDSQSGRVGATYFTDNGFFGVAIGRLENEYGIPGGLGHGQEEEQPVRIDMQQQRIDVKGELTRPMGIFRGLRLRLGQTDYEHVELEGTAEGTHFFNDSLEGRLELVQKARQLSPNASLSGSLGIQYFDRDLEAVGEEAFLPPTQTQRWALFSLQEVTTGPFIWQLGARFESQDTNPESRDVKATSHEGLSASLGMVWKATDIFSIGASASRSVKLPAPEELYSNGLHAATQTFELGSEDLQRETGLGLDLSLRLETEKVSGELTLFHQSFDNFIFQAFTGDEEEGFPIVLYSQQDATLEGVELEARVELLERNGHHLHLRLVGDMVDAQLKDDGGNLPRIPPLRLGAGLHYHSENWNASTEVQWVNDQNDVAINESPTDGYTLINASLGYRILFKTQILDLLLRGRNLGDEEARSHTSFLKTVAPLPGRDISFGLKLRF